MTFQSNTQPRTVKLAQPLTAWVCKICRCEQPRYMNQCNVCGGPRVRKEAAGTAHPED